MPFPEGSRSFCGRDIVSSFYSTGLGGLFEPVGTVLIGATLSAYLVAPWMEMSVTLSFFQISFLMSCFPGVSLGFIDQNSKKANLAQYRNPQRW